MKLLILALLVAAASAFPGGAPAFGYSYAASPYAHHGYSIGHHGYAHHGHVAAAALPYAAHHGVYAPAHASSQYHSQDELGQYSYGYAGGPSSKSEVRTADGVTRGGYSYVDGNGIVQNVNYVADPVHGFRVAATNLPVGPAPVHAAVHHAPAVHHAVPAVHHAIPAVHHAIPAVHHIAHNPVHDTPEVAAAKIAHFAAHAEVRARGKRGVHAAFPYAHGLVHASQYQSQDAIGQYNYGYNDGLSSKSETRTADGVTRGGYSYVDANGIVQSVNYVADAVHGFRVAATNLPVGPAPVHAAAVHHAPAVHHAVPAVHHAAAVHHAPAIHHAFPAAVHHAYPAVHHIAHNPVHDTPEVAAAKVEHFAAVAAARALHAHV